MLRAAALALPLILFACSPPGGSDGLQRSATATDIEIEAPAAGARVTSPLLASGTADNSWYFEAVFPARLVGDDGELIAEAPAIAHSDWTTPGPVRFNVEMTFSVDAETPATLVLSEDMPSGDPPEREVRIPVVLLPTQ